MKLKGSFDLLHERLQARSGHFFDPSLLQSQLDTLEEPGDDEAMTVDVGHVPEAIVEEIVVRLREVGAL